MIIKLNRAVFNLPPIFLPNVAEENYKVKT